MFKAQILSLKKEKKKKYDHEGCALSEHNLGEEKILTVSDMRQAEHSSTGDTGCLSGHTLASGVLQIWLISKGVLSQLDPELDVQKEVFMLFLWR